MDDARLMRLSRLRVMIEEEGLCNVIGELANALDMIDEECFETFGSSELYLNNEALLSYQKLILDAAMNAVDIDGRYVSNKIMFEKLVSLREIIDKQYEILWRLIWKIN